MNAAMRFERPCRKLTVCAGQVLSGEFIKEPTLIKLEPGSGLWNSYLAHSFVECGNGPFPIVIFGCSFAPNG